MDGCKAACLELPRCNAFLMSAWHTCFRKDLLSVGGCLSDSSLNLYYISVSSPPLSPPTPKPPPRPPWRAGAGEEVVALLNRAFAAGVEGTSNAEIPGVLLHQWDNFGEKSDTPWVIKAPEKPLSDRLSASLINAKHRAIFEGQGGTGGFVIAPEYNRILCSWSVDAGTMNRRCDKPPPGIAKEDCIPGCSGREKWCEEEDENSRWYCPWGPEHTRDMVSQQISWNAGRYNEVRHAPENAVLTCNRMKAV